MKSVTQNIRRFIERLPGSRIWPSEPGLRTTGLHDSHTWVDEGATVGSCRINRLLFADDLVLLAS